MQFFRNFFKSKIGAIAALVLLVLIALAFASGDVASTGSFGGVAGGDRVATVGKDRIDTSQLREAATTALNRVKDENPRMSMQAFVAGGGFDQVLDDLLNRTAIAEFGRQFGIVASTRLIDSEITQMGAFKGPDGTFSQDVFNQVIAQRGISEQVVRNDLEQGLIARQVLLPAAFGAHVPREFAKRYAALLKDRRTGGIAVFPSALFAPQKAPTDAELTAFYKANRDDFIRPERRVIRYATFGADALKNVPEPTDSEIEFRYNENKARYAASETRTLTQLVVPTEAAANAIVAEVKGGKSLEAAAQSKGLQTAKLEAVEKERMAGQSAQAVADAVFSAGRGTLAAPARSPLGWHVVRVDAVNARAAVSLDQASADIAKEISVEKRRVALTEMLEKIEDGFDDGGNLAEAAKELGLEIEETPPVLADGQVYENPRERSPQLLDRVLETAFAMEENEPQLAEVVTGETFVIFDVSDIAPSAAAPLDEIKDDVKAAYLIDKGSAAARKAAEQVQTAMKKGDSLQKAMASLKKRLPPVQRVNMNREELVRMQQQARQPAPPPLALFFSMAEGTAKILAAPMDRGWFLVSLDEIKAGEIADGDPILASAQRELAGTVGNEYADSLRRAILADVGVTRNDAAIKAVRDQLTGAK
jgi:peptidyl-prolyl cis-trans isomerase D